MTSLLTKQNFSIFTNIEIMLEIKETPNSERILLLDLLSGLSTQFFYFKSTFDLFSIFLKKDHLFSEKLRKDRLIFYFDK